jgi:murein DD-endopeptidase MepM/ murein hydrolase activator NlpD
VARGVGAREAGRWAAAAARVYDLRLLRPRRGVVLRFDRATHELEAVHYEMDDRSLLVLERSGHEIHAERAPLPYFIEVKGAAGGIDHGFRDDAVAAGVPPNVISQLAELFGWDAGLGAGPRPGDQFRVLYENVWQVGAARPEPGNLIGAEVVVGGRPMTAVFFEDADGNGGYYAPSGEPVSREFLRYPVEFTEITSEFSLLRRHPILDRWRPHLGVDLAAPVGTPVQAIEGGTVVDAGWLGQLGRCVRIEHPGGVTSTYGHLSRFAPGIHEGARVERAQVIAYVGSSGLSTGAHLHFAIDRGGEYVDPLGFSADARPRLPDTARRAFEHVERAVTQQLAALPQTDRPLTVSLSRTALSAE